MSINRAFISGNLTRDPELRETGGGTAVLGFGVAVNDRVRDPQTGEWGDRANFVDCVVFGERARALAGMLSKGAKVAVEGRLRYSSWERDGQRRSKIEVVVDEVEFMRPRDGQGRQPAQTYQQAAPSPAYAAQAAPAQQPYQTVAPPPAQPYDESIPF